MFAGLAPISGCQLHFAIERFLKGYLACNETFDQSKYKSILGHLEKKYHHKLIKLWEAFKAETGDTSLSQFDEIIERLDEFEPLRYPDDVLDHGMNCTIGIEEFAPTTLESRSEPVYYVSLHKIDNLAKTIFEKVPINPHFFIRPNKCLDEFLKRDNEWLGRKDTLVTTP